MARHPNRQQLASWLNGDFADLDDHIDNCEKCAGRLDDLNSSLATTQSGGNIHAISSELGPALLAVLAPPEDLHQRISERITKRLQNRSDADLFGSLLGIPIETGRVFLDQD